MSQRLIPFIRVMMSFLTISNINVTNTERSEGTVGRQMVEAAAQ